MNREQLVKTISEIDFKKCSKHYQFERLICSKLGLSVSSKTNGCYTRCLVVGSDVILITDDRQKKSIAKLGLFGYEKIAEVGNFVIIVGDYMELVDYNKFRIIDSNYLFGNRGTWKCESYLDELCSSKPSVAWLQHFVEVTKQIVETFIEDGIDCISLDAHSGNIRIDVEGRVVPYDIFIDEECSKVNQPYSCRNCGYEIDTEDDAVFYDGSVYCQECYTELFFFCKKCYDVCYKDDHNHADDELCDYCFENIAFECDLCGELHLEENTTLHFGSKVVCNECKGKCLNCANEYMALDGYGYCPNCQDAEKDYHVSGEELYQLPLL